MTTQVQQTPSKRQIAPVYAAGFVTAFAAHSIAANLGGYTNAHHASLLTLGLLLAVYDGAEVVLKPVFGALTDRIGPRPVVLGGLIGFAAASTGFVIAGDPAWVGLARLAQGAAAAAFSPAAATLVARLHPPHRSGRGFGRYGAWKGLGYTLGPVLGGGLIAAGGYGLLFGALAALAVLTTAACALFTPSAEPLPKTRQTVLGLARQLTGIEFVCPTAALAGSTAALAAAVGFLPVLGAQHGMGPLETGAAVTLLAAIAAILQPHVGAAHDEKRIGTRAGMATGLTLAAAGLLLAATLQPAIGMFTAAVLIGAGTGLTTPLGFAQLTATTQPARLGQTMGAAEVGRELGDAGGPLMVGAIALSGGLIAALSGLAALLAATTLITLAPNGRRTQVTKQ